MDIKWRRKKYPPSTVGYTDRYGYTESWVGEAPPNITKDDKTVLEASQGVMEMY